MFKIFNGTRLMVPVTNMKGEYNNDCNENGSTNNKLPRETLKRIMILKQYKVCLFVEQ